MYEVHGWFGLAESTMDDDDPVFARELDELRRLVDRQRWPYTLKVTIAAFNGEHFLTITGAANRRRDEAEFVAEVLEQVRRRLPGSWGLLHERDDDVANSFRVTRLARGELSYHEDVLLSPCVPVIEDRWSSE